MIGVQVGPQLGAGVDAAHGRPVGELGDREPSASNLFALCRALGVSCERFATAGLPPAEPTPARPRGRPKQPADQDEAATKKPASKRGKK